MPRKKAEERMPVVSMHMPEELLEEVDGLVRQGLFPSRGEAIRFAVWELIREKLQHQQPQRVVANRKKMALISFHMTRKALEVLKSLTEERGVTVSDLVREAVHRLVRDVAGREIVWRDESELRVTKAVEDVASKINRGGIIEKHELYSYLFETYKLSYHEIYNKFLPKLREALQRKNLVLIENEVGDFVVIDIMKLVKERKKVVAHA